MGGVRMPLLKTEHYTIDYIYSLSEGQRAELIDGVIYDMAPPSSRHQSVLGELFAEIHHYIKKNGGNCKVYAAPFAVFLNADDKTYVEPDISVICDTGKIDNRGCNGAPDWIIEIVSSSSRHMDYLIKLLKYKSSGVHEYWIVDPMRKTVAVYNFEANSVEHYNFTDKVKAGIYEDLEIDFSMIEL